MFWKCKPNSYKKPTFYCTEVHFRKKWNSVSEYCEMKPTWTSKTNNFYLYSVVPTVWLATAGPSKRARISDMATERSSYARIQNQKRTYLLVMRVTSCHAISSPPVALKTAETMKKWSLRVARGRSKMCVLRCHSQVRHLEWQPQILNAIPPLRNCWNYFLQIFCWWYLCKKPTGTVIITMPQKVMTAEHLKTSQWKKCSCFLHWFWRWATTSVTYWKSAYWCRDPMCHAPFYSCHAT
jgi:hypothetical protein